MIRRFAIVSAALLLAGCGTLPIAQTAPEPSIAQSWSKALNQCDVDALMALYHPSALFWPTTSRSLATKPDEVRRYYDAACKMLMSIGFKGAVASESVHVYGDTLVSAGLSTGVFRDREGNDQTASIRFSFTARKTDGTWLIIEHHSSNLPAVPRR